MEELELINVEIAKIDKEIDQISILINRAMAALQSENSDLMSMLTVKPPDVKPKAERSERDKCKKTFRRIAARTHEDKLDEDDDVKSKQEVFVFAKHAYERGDHETLVLISDALNNKGDPMAVMMLHARQTLNEKVAKRDSLLLSEDFIISVDFLSGDSSRAMSARLRYRSLLVGIILTRR